MPAGPDFQRAVAGQCRSRADQFRGIDQVAAAVALIAPGGINAAAGTGPEHISVR